MAAATYLWALLNSDSELNLLYVLRALVAARALSTQTKHACSVCRGGRGGGAAAAQGGSAQGSAGSEGETAQSQLLDVQAMETQASTTSLSSGDGSHRPGASLDLQGKEARQPSGQVCRSHIHSASALPFILNCQSQHAQDIGCGSLDLQPWAVLSRKHAACEPQHLSKMLWRCAASRAPAAWAQIVRCLHLRQRFEV